MVDEEIAALGTLDLLVGAGEFGLLGRGRSRRGRRRERGEPCKHNIRHHPFLTPPLISQLPYISSFFASHEIRILPILVTILVTTDLQFIIRFPDYQTYDMPATDRGFQLLLHFSSGCGFGLLNIQNGWLSTRL